MEGYINSREPQTPSPKKRVLFIITQSEFGGAQQFLFQFLKHASKDTYDFQVATGRDGDMSLLKHLAPLGIPTSVIPSLQRDIALLLDLKAITHIRKLIDSFKPDTLFLLSSKAGFVGSLAASLSHTKPNVIYRIGGWSFNDPIPPWKKRLFVMLEKYSARWKDIIIVNSTKDLDDAKRLHIRPHKELLLIHNGVDPYPETLSREETRIKLSEALPEKAEKILQAKNIVGTLANMYPAKGLEYFIQTAALVSNPETIFCIIGDGTERSKLERLIEEKGLSNKVFLFGQLDKGAQYLPAFDIFILTSLKEGSPWSLLQAMSAKLPVIATRVGAVPEIIEEGISGFIVEPQNTTDMAQKIEFLLQSPSKAREMGIRAHQRVLFAFSVTPMVNRIEELL
jgi:glycosyltransferase involved in cell wall biosynthesis